MTVVFYLFMSRMVPLSGWGQTPFFSFYVHILNQNPVWGSEGSGPWLPLQPLSWTLCSSLRDRTGAFPASGLRASFAHAAPLPGMLPSRPLTAYPPLIQNSAETSLTEHSLNTVIPFCTFPFLMTFCMINVAFLLVPRGQGPRLFCSPLYPQSSLALCLTQRRHLWTSFDCWTIILNMCYKIVH